MRIRCILDAVEEFAPRALQESYDNAGMQAGDAANDCTGVLLTLDVTEQTVDEAIGKHCNLIISHHPLLFKGLKALTPATAAGRILSKAIRHGLTIYAAHTNLDNAVGGVSRKMAEMLGLTDVAVLQPQKGILQKIVVFVPAGHEEAVKDAMYGAGAGKSETYDRCSYSMSGTGEFRPLAGSHPFRGEPDRQSQTAETRIEAIATTWAMPAVIRAMLNAHPYEMPAYDILPLANPAATGSGIIGSTARPTTAANFVSRLKETFHTPVVRFGGNTDMTVNRVALCGGSGAFLIDDAIAAKADIYVTGDLKYHDFSDAAGRIMLADIGHYESEQCAKDILAGIITRTSPDTAIFMAETDINPIKYI